MTREIHEQIAEMIRTGAQGVVATVIRTDGSTPRKIGAKMVITEKGDSVGTVGGGSVEALVMEEAASVLRGGVPRVCSYELTEGGGQPDALCGGRMEVLFEPLVAPEVLYVFGAGHIALPLARMAGEAGFRVVVIDPRRDLANRERFAGANEILLQNFEKAASEIPLGPDSYVVVVTPNHEHDEEVVRAILGRSYRYIGMIGSRKKVSAILDHLRKAGFSEDVIAGLHAPIGLDIGAETPEEIAVSILAELVAVRRGSAS